jgi:hypothetical protein
MLGIRILFDCTARLLRLSGTLLFRYHVLSFINLATARSVAMAHQNIFDMDFKFHVKKNESKTRMNEVSEMNT